MKIRKHLTKLLLLLLLVSNINDVIAQVKILPFGNSITYDNRRSPDNRVVGDRISYRYELYNHITNAGYEFEFVGSESSGGNFLPSGYTNNGGFPGIEADELANLVQTSWNPVENRYENTSGLYITRYNPDVILLHIGTNNVENTTSSDVAEILDNIRLQSSNAIIFIAKIINRAPYHSTTTSFNNSVESMVNMRGDSKIVLVDMENGAGLNYSTSPGGDMHDDLHPNASGYAKMADKWWEAIDSYNSAPVISGFLNQGAEKGESFNDLDLDDFVVDVEDPDFNLNWAYTAESNSDLNISISGSRILQVSPKTSDWVGSEIIKFKVTDSGSGIFAKSDSVEVTFTVVDSDLPPTITKQLNTPEIITGNSYTVIKSDIEYNDPDTDENDLTLEVQSGSFYTTIGNEVTPINGFIGQLSVNIQIKDLISSSETFAFAIDVIKDPNHEPEIISSPLSKADDYEPYSYTVEAKDDDEDQVSFFAKELPSWANFASVEGKMDGTPKWFDADSFHNVSLGATDGKDTVFQNYQVYVGDNNDSPSFTSSPDTTADYSELYVYIVEYLDYDENDTVELNILSAPDWLELSDNFLTGTPDSSDYNSRIKITLSVTDGKQNSYQSFYLNISGPSSGLRQNKTTNFSVYPNPTTNEISFDLSEFNEEVEVSVWNMTGKEVLSYSNIQGGTIRTLNVENLNSGIYLINIRGEKQNLSSRFVKH